MAWCFKVKKTYIEESFRRKLFGCKNKKNIKKDDKIFLYNTDEKSLYGYLIAKTDITKNIVKNAWKGGYPWQVKISWSTIYKTKLEDLPIDDIKNLENKMTKDKSKKIILKLKNGEIANIGKTRGYKAFI